MGTLLVRTGGVLNAVFVAFHVFLGFRIHNFSNIAPGYRALMEMLNAGGVIFIALFAYASVFCVKDLLGTHLGRAVLWTTVLTYGWRAVEEVVISLRFSPVIFASCLLMAGIYAAAIVLAGRRAGSMGA